MAKFNVTQDFAGYLRGTFLMKYLLDILAVILFVTGCYLLVTSASQAGMFGLVGKEILNLPCGLLVVCLVYYLGVMYLLWRNLFWRNSCQLRRLSTLNYCQYIGCYALLLTWNMLNL